VQSVYDKKEAVMECLLLPHYSRYIFKGNFPHLFVQPEKRFRKVKNWRVWWLFTYKQNRSIQLKNSGGIYRRLSRIIERADHAGRYHDSVDDKIFQPHKVAWSAEGRGSRTTGDNRTTTGKLLFNYFVSISCRVVTTTVSGQFNGAFIKPQDPFTNRQIEATANKLNNGRRTAFRQC
jgi:hypothetical protein